MNTQQRLNFSTPMTRSSDPTTSIIAESNHIQSGKRKRNCDLILEAIRNNPDSTSAELAEITGLDRHEAARRCSDLRANGLIRNTDNHDINGYSISDENTVTPVVFDFFKFKRKCRVKKTLCIIWRAV